jgi:hypothetical protein
VNPSSPPPRIDTDVTSLLLTEKSLVSYMHWLCHEFVSSLWIWVKNKIA